MNAWIEKVDWMEEPRGKFHLYCSDNAGGDSNDCYPSTIALALLK